MIRLRPVTASLYMGADAFSVMFIRKYVGETAVHGLVTFREAAFTASLQRLVVIVAAR